MLYTVASGDDSGATTEVDAVTMECDDRLNDNDEDDDDDTLQASQE